MKTLSVKQPFAYLLCAGIKDIENRSWKLPKKYKNEWVLIHASAKMVDNLKPDGCTSHLFSEWQRREIKNAFPHSGIDRDYPGNIYSPFYFFKHDLGAIIGAVKFSDCVINHPSIWAEKSDNMDQVFMGFKKIYNWVVSDAILFDKPILDVKGKLGFWDYDLPEEYVKLLK